MVVRSTALGKTDSLLEKTQTGPPTDITCGGGCHLDSRPKCERSNGNIDRRKCGRRAYDPGARKDSFDKTSEAQARRQKMCESGDIKISDFCLIKDTMDRVRRETPRWERKRQG